MATAPCAYFLKLDAGINKFFSNLGMGIFPWFLRVKSNNKYLKKNKKNVKIKKNKNKKCF